MVGRLGTAQDSLWLNRACGSSQWTVKKTHLLLWVRHERNKRPNQSASTDQVWLNVCTAEWACFQPKWKPNSDLTHLIQAKGSFIFKSEVFCVLTEKDCTESEAIHCEQDEWRERSKKCQWIPSGKHSKHWPKCSPLFKSTDIPEKAKMSPADPQDSPFCRISILHWSLYLK